MTSFSDFAVGEPTADLAVSVSDGLASVVAGDGLTHAYTITVTNGGPSDATAVSLTDSWPSGFSQGAISPSQGSCSPIGAGPDFSCGLGTIAAGGERHRERRLHRRRPRPTRASRPRPRAVAARSSTRRRPTTARPTRRRWSRSSTLTVTKDDGLASVVAGDGLSHAYTITVTNAGPVRRRQRRPRRHRAGGIHGRARPSADLGGDCTGSLGNTIACALPASLAPGATWTITIPYTVGPARRARDRHQHRARDQRREPGRHHGLGRDRRHRLGRSRASASATAWPAWSPATA